MRADDTGKDGTKPLVEVGNTERESATLVQKMTVIDNVECERGRRLQQQLILKIGLYQTRLRARMYLRLARQWYDRTSRHLAYLEATGRGTWRIVYYCLVLLLRWLGSALGV